MKHHFISRNLDKAASLTSQNVPPVPPPPNRPRSRTGGLLPTQNCVANIVPERFDRDCRSRTYVLPKKKYLHQHVHFFCDARKETLEHEHRLWTSFTFIDYHCKSKCGENSDFGTCTWQATACWEQAHHEAISHLLRHIMNNSIGHFYRGRCNGWNWAWEPGTSKYMESYIS